MLKGTQVHDESLIRTVGALEVFHVNFVLRLKAEDSSGWKYESHEETLTFCATK